MQPKKIVIYGGAFDPPHVGHAAVVGAIIRRFPCDGLWFVPSGSRRDKPALSPGKHRCALLQAMAEDYALEWRKTPVAVCTVEVESGLPSATATTKRFLEERHPGHEFHFFFTSDLLSRVEREWLDGEALYATARFLCAVKPGSPLPERLPPRVTALRGMPWLPVSSTLVRERLRAGLPADSCLSPRVAAYIREHRLYERVPG